MFQLAPDDAWRCPHCKQLQQGRIKLSLWTLPDVLILHLKRFRQVFQLNQNTVQIETRNVELDLLSEYLDQELLVFIWHKVMAFLYPCLCWTC